MLHVNDFESTCFFSVRLSLSAQVGNQKALVPVNPCCNLMVASVVLLRLEPMEVF